MSAQSNANLDLASSCSGGCTGIGAISVSCEVWSHAVSDTPKVDEERAELQVGHVMAGRCALWNMC